MIDTLVSAVRRAGLRVEGIDLEAFALIRSLVPTGPSDHDGAHVLCHIAPGRRTSSCRSTARASSPGSSGSAAWT